MIDTLRPHRDRGYLVGFGGVADRAAAEALRGEVLTVAAAERRALDESEFWPDQLVGLEVVDDDGRRLGRITDVVPGPGQDRLVVTTPLDVNVLVPFVSDLVGEPEDGRIVIRPPSGLFP